MRHINNFVRVILHLIVLTSAKVKLLCILLGFLSMIIYEGLYTRYLRYCMISLGTLVPNSRD